MNFLSKFFEAPAKDVVWFQTLQQRVDEKFKFFENISKTMYDFNKILKTFSDKLEIQCKNFDSISYTLEEQYLFDTYKLIHSNIVDIIKGENTFAENNLKMLEIHINKYKVEMNIYNNLKNIRKNLIDKKEELKNNKKEYHLAGIEMEKNIKKFVKENIDNLDNLTNQLKNQLNGFAKNPKRLLKKYKDSIQKVNELTISFNTKQDELFAHLPNFGKEDNEFFSKISTNYLNDLQKNIEFLGLTKQNMNIIQENEKKNQLNNLINECENNKNEEQKMELFQYQSSLEFIKCKDKNEFDLTAKVVDTINKTIGENIFPNFNYEVDLKTFKEAKLIKQLFEMDEIDDKTQKELLDSLDDKMNHKAMFIVLSQLRTNSTFHRPKSFIEVFGKAFNKMINMANKDEIFDYVKNCIILSQTYFCNDENNNDKKVYLFEKIKSNKILNNSHFWRGFIDYLIKLEFDRFKKHHSYPDYDVEKSDNIPKRIKHKFDEIVFSQLLSFITNLNDFEMDKRVILKITDEFVQKYNYLSEKNIKGIYEIIAKEKNELEKLRKEYDISLESEKIEFNDEKKEGVNQEEKEESKEKEKWEIIDKEKQEQKEENKNEEKVGENEINTNEENEIKSDN